ncbi:MAG: class I SAM-dependent methyltransferase [Bryobacteraceae bacterium]
MRPKDFYDDLAANYHLIFEDWEASMARQAAALAPILERECGPPGTTQVLDCVCGIGTQTLGLAQRGFRMTATDASSSAVARARREAASRALPIEFAVANMLDLGQLPNASFDAVICMDNALCHLDNAEELTQAAAQIRNKLKPGGAFLASIRDYDQIIHQKPVVQGPSFFGSYGRRRIAHQLWDWLDDRRYVLHIYLTVEAAGRWDAHHYATTCRTILRAEFDQVLQRVGFTATRWLFPADTGFYQPIVIARV